MISLYSKHEQNQLVRSVAFILEGLTGDNKANEYICLPMMQSLFSITTRKEECVCIHMQQFVYLGVSEKTFKHACKNP